MNLLERLDRPLFYLDRRRPWNTLRREQYARWHSTDLNSRSDRLREYVSMTDRDADVKNMAGQAISFFKLVAIVSAGVSPLFLLFYILMNSVFQARLTDHRELMTKELDSRYVSSAIYQIQNANQVATIADNTALNKAQDQRISALENKLTQIQGTVEQIRATQVAREAVKK